MVHIKIHLVPTGIVGGFQGILLRFRNVEVCKFKCFNIIKSSPPKVC